MILASASSCGYDPTQQACLPFTGFDVLTVIVIGGGLAVIGMALREWLKPTTPGRRIALLVAAMVVLFLLIADLAGAATRVSVGTAKLYRADYRESVESHDPITNDYRNGRCHRVNARHVDCVLWRHWTDQGSGVARKQAHVVHTRATREGWSWKVTVPDGPICDPETAC